MKQVIEINGLTLTIEGREPTEKDMSTMVNSVDFKKVTSHEIEATAIKMAKRDEGVIQDEVAQELGFFEKNRGTSIFNKFEKTGVLVKTGEKRLSTRTGGLGNVYKAA